ncbi:nucleolar MIF4G domain-containing protein 1 [Trichinella spiralis]|uniref:nucleolar MIF4G domain-containing protein 1 n=1 Tax=Trichinella spiralis TaxID=6334 RepID=UPI0001EFC07F|nr:nucleolar MIF4G domain-containing protein 1 [Trichinella spiralis]
MENSCRGCLLVVTAAAVVVVVVVVVLSLAKGFSFCTTGWQFTSNLTSCHTGSADHIALKAVHKCTARVECVGGEEYFEYFSIPLVDDFIIFEHYDVSFWLLPLDGIWLLLSAYANSKRHSLTDF